MHDYDAMSDRDITMQVHTRIIAPGSEVLPWGTRDARVRGTYVSLPRYSTDANAARQVSDRMGELDLMMPWIGELRRMVWIEPEGSDRVFKNIAEMKTLIGMVNATPRDRCIAALIVMDQLPAQRRAESE